MPPPPDTFLFEILADLSVYSVICVLSTALTNMFICVKFLIALLSKE